VKRIVWLSTSTMLLACTSIAQAVARGAPGDCIHKHDPEANLPASKASHVIHATRSGRKVAIRVIY